MSDISPSAGGVLVAVTRGGGHIVRAAVVRAGIGVVRGARLAALVLCETALNVPYRLSGVEVSPQYRHSQIRVRKWNQEPRNPRRRTPAVSDHANQRAEQVTASTDAEFLASGHLDCERKSP